MELFEQAEHILKTALTAGNPAECIQNHFTIQGNDLVDKTTGKSFSLARRNIIIVGAGKATALMAKKVEEMILPVVQSVSGLISVKQGHGEVLSHIKIVEASHPVPDVRGVQAAEEILDLLDNAEKDDLVIALFSGGGSALLPLPAQGISLEDIQQTTDLLLASGAEIDEINAVRKHISRVKGGNLMRAAFPATVITLLLSDVLGNKADVIASGPFSPDDSTFAGAVNVCEKYKIRARLPDSVGEYLGKGMLGESPETPKTADPVFKKNYTKIIGSNYQSLLAAKEKAEDLGFNTLILCSQIKGEAREFGKVLGGIAREIRESGNPVSAPGCILFGGETTVTLKDPGKGGRNQECALATVKEIAGLDDVLVCCFGTDGTDGPTDAAGAWCTGDTYEQGIAAGYDSEDYIRTHDSYHYFEKCGTLIKTGPTKTNLMDIYMILVV